MIYLDIAIAGFGLSLVMFFYKGLQDMLKTKSYIDKINAEQDHKLQLIEYKLDKIQEWCEQVTVLRLKD